MQGLYRGFLTDRPFEKPTGKISESWCSGMICLGTHKSSSGFDFAFELCGSTRQTSYFQNFEEVSDEFQQSIFTSVEWGSEIKHPQNDS